MAGEEEVQMVEDDNTQVSESDRLNVHLRRDGGPSEELEINMRKWVISKRARQR